MLDKQKNQNPRGCYISLACSIGSFSIACGSLLQLNSASDRISLQRGLFLTSLGFVYFISLTDFFNKYLLQTRQGIQFRRKYRLMVSDVMDITNKIVSTIQAAFSCIAGFIVCKSSCTKSFLYASHFVMEAYAWFGTAYFMYDIWSMYKVHTHKIADKLRLMSLTPTTPSSATSLATAASAAAATANRSSTNNTLLANGLYDKHSGSNLPSPSDAPLHKFDFGAHKRHHEDEIDYGEDVPLPKNGRWGFLMYILHHPIMIMHHIFIGTFGLIVVTYLRGGFGDCVYSFIYLMEFSTPFVSLRSILSTMGLKDTRVYIVNGLVMLATFLICRILMWPYVLYWYSEAINRPFVQAIMGLPRNCKISIMILFLPQIYWFSLMVKGAMKVFFPPKQKRVTKSDSDIVRAASAVPTSTKFNNNGTSNNHSYDEGNLIKRSASPARTGAAQSNTSSITQGRSLM